MYIKHFGLRDHPFRLTPDSSFLYLSKMHARAKSYMDFTAISRDSFVVITGEIGSGKTTLIQALLSELDDSVLVARVHQTQLNDEEFLQAILVEFGFNPFNARKVELLNMLNMYLIEQYGQGRRALLIVDEAQNLSKRVLEEVRLLSGLETQKEKILNVMLVGQPELNEKLDAPGLEQLAQRIRFRFHLKALGKKDTKNYIRHRLEVAGADNLSLFSDDAIQLVYEYTGGVPRLINTLCDTALICAFADDIKAISARGVRKAIHELQWVPYAQRQHGDDTLGRDPRLSTSEHVRKVVITLKGNLVAEYPLYKKRISIGRRESNDIHVDDPVVSRAHAQLITHGGEVYIEDLKSENGTYVNSERISSRSLHNGDLITVGSYQIKYVDEPSTASGDARMNDTLDDFDGAPAADTGARPGGGISNAELAWLQGADVNTQGDTADEQDEAGDN